MLPAGFVYLENVAPTIVQDIKYFTHDNFIGRPIQGYLAPKCIVTREAAQALEVVQKTLQAKNLSLKVFDCYRPTTAVEDFIQWSKDIADQKMKAEYYPYVDKKDFFKLGYVAEKSSHSRGSTADVTIVQFDKNGQPIELDMGTHFDFMDETSHPLNPTIKGQEKTNRLLLRSVMEQAGFVPLETEWWHFTLKNEPYPNTCFNFLVS